MIQTENLDFSKHPCFNAEARKHSGRVHLPVAPKCNIQCNFCNRKYDCVNESRPGVTTTVLTPGQALAYLDIVLEKRPEISVMGIAGPGDPFANPEETMETLSVVREKYPDLILCLASNGLGIAPYIPEIAKLNTSHVTITINAVDPAIAAEVYAWARDNRKIYRGLEAGKLMVSRQLEAVRLLKEHGVVVKVNSIIIPGVNDHHIPEIAQVVSQLGADIQNCMPLLPTKDTVFEDLPQPKGEMVARVRLQSGEHMHQMSHCARCRADAIGMLGESMSEETIQLLESSSRMPVRPQEDRPYVAAASMEGMLVNQHLGEANQFLVFSHEQDDSFRLVEIRKAPPTGGGDDRWKELAKALHDCRTILVNAAGPSPTLILKNEGIAIVEMEGMIEEGLRCIFNNQPLSPSLRRRFTGCGSGVSCKGTGTGCA